MSSLGFITSQHLELGSPQHKAHLHGAYMEGKVPSTEQLQSADTRREEGRLFAKSCFCFSDFSRTHLPPLQCIGKNP